MSHDPKRAAQRAVVAWILEGDGRAPRDERRAAFDNAAESEPLRTLIEKVALHPRRVTDGDVAAVIAAGRSEDEVFELVVCAAVGQATRHYEAALGVLAEAMGDAHAS